MGDYNDISILFLTQAWMYVYHTVPACYIINPNNSYTKLW